MKALILLLALLQPNAWAGQETQNGSGLAEQNIAYALTLLRPIYQMCLADRAGLCLKTIRERQILFSVNRDLETERKSPTLLRFLPGNDPIFVINGAVRVAVTSLEVGTAIFINQDLIYRKFPDGRTTPFTVEEGISLLTHELGHHQGELDHDLLDALGANVRAFFESERERIPIDTFSGRFQESKVAINVHHWRNPFPSYQHRSTFWLTVNDKVFDVNEGITRHLVCPKSQAGVDMQVVGYRFHNMHWEDPLPTRAGLFVYPLSARLWLQCREKSGTNANHVAIPYETKIFFQFTPAGRTLDFLPGGVYVQSWARSAGF